MVTCYLRGYTSLLEELGVKGRVPAYYVSLCLNQTVLLSIFLSIAETRRRILGCIMDIYSLFSEEAQPPKLSFPLESPASNQEDLHQYVRYSHQGCGFTMAERRSFMAASQLTLSRKRSIRSLVSEHVQKAQASEARPPSPSRQPRTTLSPWPQHYRNYESANDAPRPLLQSFGPVKACAAEQEVSLKCQSKPASLRTLSSPIKFKGSLESFATNPDRDFMDHSAHMDQSKYLYYPPTNPSDAAQRFSRLHDSGPKRRLSYGESPDSPDSRIFHKTTASRDLRRKASLHVKDDNCFSLYHQNPKAIQARSWSSKSSQPKPRLWLDQAEDEEIEKMVSLRSLPNQRTCSWLRC